MKTMNNSMVTGQQAQREKAEQRQRQAIDARFAGRAPTPRTADFDFPAPSDSVSDQLNWVMAPHYRGYAVLGVGQYLINHSDTSQPAELVISVATEQEKAGRIVGDERENLPGALLQPDAMAVRIRFDSVAGLDALENQLRKLRADHFSNQPSEQRLPDGWTRLNMIFDEDSEYPETIAYGPPEMMVRLGKKMDKYYTDLIEKRNKA